MRAKSIAYAALGVAVAVFGSDPAVAQKIIHVDQSPFRVNPLNLKVTKSFGGALILRVRPARKAFPKTKMQARKSKSAIDGKPRDQRVRTGFPESRLPRDQRVRTGFPESRLPRDQRVRTGFPESRLPRDQRVRTGLPGTRLPPNQRVRTGFPESRLTPSHRVHTDLFPVRVIKFGQVSNNRGVRRVMRRKGRLRKKGFVGFSVPQQTYFPPYYNAPRPWAHGPDLQSRIEGGKTIRQGSSYASRIKPGKTVKQGSRYASRIQGGKTVEQGSHYASQINPGLTVEQGSPWASRIPNWKFSGFAAPMRPRGIPYYDARRRKRSPWASRF
ncbi:MAG: hypothetical protein MPJ78_16410 [Hyphomicrobiaceae bacterium]|nr:hypothetical protein [Hyphomicrobiaceae bacterium]